jgi:hypothetical protein
MNVGIGTAAAQFLSWEYLFRIFGIRHQNLKVVSVVVDCTHISLEMNK